jgi:hypothetical protein
LIRLDNIDVAEHGGSIESLSENTLGGFYQQSLLCFEHPDIVAASCNLYTSSNVEVLQTKFVSWSNTAHRLELCFIFYYSDVIDGKFCCEGMMNAFDIRNIAEPICREGRPFLSFLILYPMYLSYWSSCWSSEVWDE